MSENFVYRDMLKLYENFYDNFPLSGRTTSILLVLTIRWHIFPTCRYFIFFSFILQSLSISFNENHNIDIKFALPDFALNYLPSVNSIFFFSREIDRGIFARSFNRNWKLYAVYASLQSKLYLQLHLFIRPTAYLNYTVKYNLTHTLGACRRGTIDSPFRFREYLQ